MPIILRWNYTDGTYQDERLDVQIWRKNEQKIVKTFIRNKQVKSIQMDPFYETADIDVTNNQWNVGEIPTRFEIFQAKREPRRGGRRGTSNPMQLEKKGKGAN